MKKETEKLVRETASMSSSMSALTVDKINEIAPDAPDAEVRLSTKERAALEKVRYLEPTKVLQAIGKLKPEWKKIRDYDWEYVKGMFQGEVVNGVQSLEPKKFWFAKWPGDQDSYWEVPVGVPVYLPRMIAIYLAGERDKDTGMESMKYHTFDYLQRPEAYWKKDDFTHQFSAVSTVYRGRFVPMGVFS